MARGEFEETSSFAIATGPYMSMGVEGEMARVSIASLLEGAGLSDIPAPPSIMGVSVSASMA